MNNPRIPFLSLDLQHNTVKQEIQAAIQRVYDSNWFILGKEVEAFEKEYAAYNKMSFCVGVGNGLDALTMSLLACGIETGDEVIVPAHTYLATWLAITRTGATIVPVEPDENTFNIDVSRIEAAITARTKAILPVHLYGQACDMTAIMEQAEQHNLFVIEDNAQAQGARWLQNLTGSFGHVNATSFYPTKNLGALGDGGAVTTPNEDKAQFVKQFRNYGLAEKNIAVRSGINSRLDEVQAAVLRIKLKHLDEWNEQRRQIASLYLEQLNGIGDIVLPLSDKEAYHVYHLFVIRTEHRDRLQKHLANAAIETMIHYPIPPHLQQSYSGLHFKKGEFPLTEKIANTSLSLPLWPGMTSADVERIGDEIKVFFLR
ncbi:DegT/DnrJ/EryC1/StrS family aminotransferase [Ohtaekwangia koreensis]|uniref:dTDP-4-amino-4,6-dideoxygalactose transaminase n=1 Tax=Ohtaekwangia koreensis TaxID=688867 RepID=A0A1T5LMI7_9BACT|nr:DegT/DnrJ/EryC1/StrS family aminotransferase [Ohtaekwangia koreensis]SKC77170.1 dTDP-4-amino-4,6-dideoxygalactose transaminase [Ohtaekwangia koreensis]